MPSEPELLADARRLEAQAATVGEDGPSGRELRAQAAAVRVRALGERSYPVLVCQSCYRVTGWTDAAGSCSSCLAAARLRAAFADPAGGWVELRDGRPSGPRRSALPLGARLAAAVGRRQGLEHAIARAWRTRVAPAETGPATPEAGYEVEVAKRSETEAPDGSGVLVQFTTARYRFDGAAWLALDRTKISQAEILIPSEFSAGLPVEQLAEAWVDFQAAVATFNRDAWARNSAERDADRQARAEHADTLLRERHVSELLDEGD